MTSTMSEADTDLVRAVARAVLVAAVRGRRDRGGPWGEAVLAEFGQTTGRWEAVRWTAGGLRAVWQERRAKARTRPRYVRISRRILTTAVVGLLAALAVIQFVLTPRYMASGSMEPTVQIGDRYLVDRVGPHVTGIRHGDVVEFPIPDARDRPALKRIIGLPGDVIECRDGKVFRDGVQLTEAYLGRDTGESLTECTAVTVPAGSLYVLGDHRLVSQDSRHWGFIAESEVTGRYLLPLWPVR
jgi:signal peptidase I